MTTKTSSSLGSTYGGRCVRMGPYHSLYGDLLGKSYRGPSIKLYGDKFFPYMILPDEELTNCVLMRISERAGAELRAAIELRKIGKQSSFDGNVDFLCQF